MAWPVRSRAQEAMAELVPMVMDGRIRHREDVRDEARREAGRPTP